MSANDPLITTTNERMGEPSIRQVGLAQRLLLWAVFAGFAAVLYYPLLLLAIPFQLYCVYRLAKALRMSTVLVVVCLLLMFIPLVSLICLLVLNGKATRALKHAGIRVGLMGATTADLPAA